MTAFIITRDLIDDGMAVGVVGPGNASDKDEARLKAGEGIEFRLLDDDGEVYYYGRRLEESDAGKDYEVESEFAPLECWGLPNAGCTIQEEKNKEDKWEAL
jgi:hypothetical protein